MNLITSTCHPSTQLRCDCAVIPTPPRVSMALRFNTPSFPFYSCPLLNVHPRRFVTFAKKKDSKSKKILKPTIVQEATMDADEGEDGIEDDVFLEDFEDDEQVEDDGSFEDEHFEEEAELFVGDGAGGGGIKLAGTPWDKKALEIAEEIALSFNGELGIYAFKTMLNSNIQVRIERLTNKSGSPSMQDIEAFSIAYRERLDEAEATGNIPVNISLEVSSPGVERVVRVPQDLERFKDRNLYVRYVTKVLDTGSLSEHDGVFRLISYDSEGGSCTWGLADVRLNREKAGKGRPLSKKQREWRLTTPLDSLLLVRFYSEV